MTPLDRKMLTPAQTEAREAREAPEHEVTVSIVVPLYNEEEAVDAFYRELATAVDGLGYRIEMVFVDDGSNDRTLEICARLHEEDPRVNVVALSRNHGHQLALSAGLAFARGDVAITMDGDLQHPPELIGRMLAAWKDGAEVVQMVKDGQANRGRIKTWSANLFYEMFRRIGEVELNAHSSDFRLLGAKALGVIRSMPERERFLRGMTSWIGFKRVEIKFAAPARRHGSAKYTMRKLRNLAVAGVFSFSTVPLTVSIYVGFFMAMFAFLYGSHALIFKLLGHDQPAGFTDIFVGITGLAGVQLLFLGIIGTYVGRIFQEVKARPLFVVEDVIGFEEAARSEREARPGVRQAAS